MVVNSTQAVTSQSVHPFSNYMYKADKYGNFLSGFAGVKVKFLDVLEKGFCFLWLQSLLFFCLSLSFKEHVFEVLGELNLTRC